MAPEKQTADDGIRIAIVDDDARVVETIATFLRSTKCELQTFTNSRMCMDSVLKRPVDILITDLDMPEVDGITLLRKVGEMDLPAEVIIVTAHADKAVAIQALRLGAFDFMEKPVDGTELVETVERAVRYRTVVAERDRFAEQVSFLAGREAEQWGKGLVGESRAMKRVLSAVRLLQGVPRTSVLITGESGTGKELVARAIHYGGGRGQHPFVPVNCSAVPRELAESLLFGHVKGAFTGATSDKKGCFELAHKGTLFLDEIGDMPHEMQAKLLRVLEDGVVTPVGASAGSKVNVRVIAATNTDLAAKMVEKNFRSDLFYRLTSYQLELPPLRDRAEDIPLLARHFVSLLSAEMGFAVPCIREESLDVLAAHTFPGNVRELKNLLERALIESGSKDIEPRHIHFLDIAPHGPQQESSRPELPRNDLSSLAGSLNLQEAEALLIKQAMARSNGNVSRAAKSLGINRTKLYRKLATIG